MAKAKGGRDRPKSSSNTKNRKKGGSPDGSEVGEGPMASMDAFPQPPIVDVIRGPEIEELLITKEDMLAMRPSRPSTPLRQLREVEVRKQRSVSNLPTKAVSVLKRVDAELSDIAGQSSGPRFTNDGEILSYSVLGPVEDFKQGLLATGQENLVDTQTFGTVMPKAPQPVIVTPSVNEDLPDNRESQALQNWELQLKAHSKQANFLSRKTGKAQTSLLMNSTDYRAKQEERTIIDRAIPCVDQGKGFRVGSEFWSQPQMIGESIVMTLNQSEQGNPPDIEHIGRPLSSEQGHVYPWKRNKFCETRKEQLSEVISEQVGHQPDFTGLYVKGGRELTKQREAISPVHEEESPEEVVTEPVTQIIEEEKRGPALCVNGVESTWGGDREQKVIRMLFTTDAGVMTTQHLELYNSGTTAMFYYWRFVPKVNKLNTIMEGNVQRFYFSINDGVILPGQKIKVPFIFLSKQAGIYTEGWQFITRPTLNEGAPIIIALKGVASRRDVYKHEKQMIEEMLEKRQAQYTIKLMVDEIVRGVHTPPPPPTPPPPGPTLQERFNKLNPHLFYQSDIYASAKELWASITEEGSVWDDTMDSLRMAVLALSSEEQVEKMELFNSLREKLSRARPVPFSQPAYDLCYGCLVSAFDALEDTDLVLRAQLELPPRVHIEEVPPPEADTISEKTDDGKRPSALISPAPDSKKGKKDDKKPDKKPVDKKDSKPKTTSRGSKKSDVNVPEEEEVVEVKEWVEIEDPVLKRKYYEKLYITTYGLLSNAAEHISMALDEL